MSSCPPGPSVPRRPGTLLGLLLLGCCLLLGAPARGDERILAYDSVVRLARDGSLKVTETLRVNAEGDQIRRGLYRDFPTRYRDPQGRKVRVPFEVLEVLLDGEEAPWRTENRDDGVRLYVGQEDRLVPPGVHTYLLAYRTAGQVGFFADHDELYWNVTGNGWIFPIERATCRILLPEVDGGIPPFLALTAFTGLQGEQGTDASSRVDPDGSASFSATRTLQPREGLTVAASWPKGVVLPPAERPFDLWALRDRTWFLLGCALGGITLLYFLLVWAKVGRDPRPGVLVPRFAPPSDFSPAACRLLRRMAFDDRAFTAALLDLAVKGLLRLRQDEEATVLELQDRGWENLSAEETRLLRTLFRGDRKTFPVSPEEHKTLKEAQDKVRETLEKKLKGTFFATNGGWWAGGILLSLLSLGALLVGRMDEAPEIPFLGLGLLVWTGGVLALLQRVRSRWSLWWHGEGRRGLLFLKALGITLFSLPLLAGEVFALGTLAYEAGAPTAGIIALLGLTDGIFRKLLKAPSLKGRTALDEIEGFRLYLSVAEKDRMNLLNPPRRTPELFERFLPYALALDVEQNWSESFSEVLAQASREREGAYVPVWYVGGGFDPARPGAFASSLGSGLTSSIAAASTPPGSTSGFGGGSSGGGGGGGGGGGW